MPEEKSFPIKRILISVALIGALSGAIFGFVAGFFASTGYMKDALTSVLPEEMGEVLELPGSQKDEGGEVIGDETTNEGGEVIGDETPKSEKNTMSEEEAIVDVVENAAPAVVSIVADKDVPVFESVFYDPFGGNDFFRQFFEGLPGFGLQEYRQKGTERQRVGAGTGFLVSGDGYIVTNRHVVSDTDADYTVIMQDGEKNSATVLARDTVNDIAVVKIEGEDFGHIEFGDSGEVRVGQTVIAIGYALGRFGNTVSRGIVSGLQRSIRASDMNTGVEEDLFDVIQTDAAINPGNSGGPLLDLEGRAIGMNVAIVQGSENIGFALPINDVRAAVESVKATGKISRPFLGVRHIMINEQLKEANQLPVDYGALVVRGEQVTDLAVMPGSPADKAGVVENDIILEVNGRRIDQNYPLTLAVRKFAVDDEITLKVLRKGEETELVAVLTEKE